ncbi:DNA replication/repair protein RecF [Motiliproteus sediminis]|uniref:DNA replication/repair protein RecF n=1 Tax=Motiliproteus sediminis TaxID=1468178 RepID=UPI001AEF3D44
MSVTRLDIHHLRNIASLRLDLSAQTNLFHGPNGSGKTSVLEAVHLLSLARSFRTTQHRHYITNQQPQSTLFAQIDVDGTRVPLGFQRCSDGELSIRVDGERVDTVTSLAEQLPIQLINADTFLLLEGSPAIRRQYIDWGGFHAEPRFLATWKAVRRCLKQRNSLLKHGRMDPSVRAAWDQELVRQAEALDSYRAAYLQALIPRFENLLAELLPLDSLELQYYRGWDRKSPLDEVLAAGLERDCQQGFTHAGPQRADLRFKIDGAVASERLSRGQQKLVVSALKLAQGFLLQEQKGRRCVYLIDDLPAELDRNHRQRLCRLLEQMNTQVLITSTDADAFEGCWHTDTEVRSFEIRQGALAKNHVNGS